MKIHEKLLERKRKQLENIYDRKRFETEMKIQIQDVPKHLFESFEDKAKRSI